jgi:ribosomal protein S18 acetylase RimI-like enzyme
MDQARHLPSDITLRPAKPDDAALAYEIFEQTMRPYAEATWGGWHPERAREELRLACEDGCTRVIEDRGVPVGIVRVVIEPGSHTQLEKLNVAPAFQGCGIGSEVLRRVLREAAGVPVRLRVLRVNPAKRLYDRHGFRVTVEDDVRFHMEHAL